MKKNIAIIFAGGTGTRMGIENIPKQFLEVDGKPIIIYTLEFFQNHLEIDEIYIACIATWIDYMKNLVKEFKIDKVKEIVEGGKTGQDSIYNALMAARKNNDPNSNVLIHDGVRPYITYDLISDCINSINLYGSAITCTSCFETIIVSKDGNEISDVPYRKETYAAQAPQGFVLGEIIEAHNQMRKINPDYENIVDSCTLYRVLGKDVKLVQGNRGNIKVTTPEDYFQFKSLLECKKSIDETGFNVPEMSEKLKKMVIN